MAIYIISAESTGLVKIGYAKSPDARLRALQTASPHVLTLAARFEGSLAQERAIHSFLSRLRRGEWYLAHQIKHALDLLTMLGVAGLLDHFRQWEIEGSWQARLARGNGLALPGEKKKGAAASKRQSRPATPAASPTLVGIQGLILASDATVREKERALRAAGLSRNSAKRLMNYSLRKKSAAAAAS